MLALETFFDQVVQHRFHPTSFHSNRISGSFHSNRMSGIAHDSKNIRKQVGIEQQLTPVPRYGTGSQSWIAMNPVAHATSSKQQQQQQQQQPVSFVSTPSLPSSLAPFSINRPLTPVQGVIQRSSMVSTPSMSAQTSTYTTKTDAKTTALIKDMKQEPSVISMPSFRLSNASPALNPTLSYVQPSPRLVARPVVNLQGHSTLSDPFIVAASKSPRLAAKDIHIGPRSPSFPPLHMSTSPRLGPQELPFNIRPKSPSFPMRPTAQMMNAAGLDVASEDFRPRSPSFPPMRSVISANDNGIQDELDSDVFTLESAPL